MTSKHSSFGAAALRYASALVDMAAEAGAIDSVEKDIQEFEAMLQGSTDLQKAVTSPLISRKEQKNAVLALAEKAHFHDLTRNFLALLCDNRRMNMISAVIYAVRTDLSRRRGEVSAQVQAAYELSASQIDALQKSLSTSTGRNVALNVEVNRDLIGGMVVTVGSRMVDDSVKRKLERLKNAITSGSNQNLNEKEQVS